MKKEKEKKKRKRKAVMPEVIQSVRHFCTRWTSVFMPLFSSITEGLSPTNFLSIGKLVKGLCRRYLFFFFDKMLC